MTINLRHETFIREMIAHGNRIHAYQTAYPGVSPQTAKVNAACLMAKHHITIRITEAVLKAEDEVSTRLKQQYENELMDILDKRRELARFVLGRAREKHIKLYNKIVTVMEEPNPMHILNAISLDLKLEASLWRKIS